MKLYKLLNPFVAIFSALIWQTQYTYEKFNNSRLCIKNGNGLAAIKMPGGNLPYDIDVDSGFSPDDYDQVFSEYRKFMKSEFNIAAAKSVSKKKNRGFELHHLRGSHFWVDHYR